MSDVETEIAALRAEIVELRKNLDRALNRLDLPTSRYPDYKGTEYATMEFDQVSLRRGKMHIPVILHTDDCESGVFLHDDKMRVRGQFVIYADGQARLEILNAEGKVVVSIGEQPDGRGELRANDADGTTRAGMKVSEHGGALSVVTPEGKTLAALASGPEGGNVFVCTPQQKAAITLKSAAHGGMIVIADPSGQVMGSFNVAATGAVLSVYGEQGERAVTLSGLGELGGQAVFYTPDGEKKAMLP